MYFFTILSISNNFSNKKPNSDIFTILGPSLGALSGSSCVSKKTPAIPTAVAAFERTGTNSLCPPDLAPSPPGCCTSGLHQI